MTYASHTGPHIGRAVGRRALTIPQLVSMTTAREAGIGADVLAHAIGISRRTVYRWMAAEVVEVEVEGWRARFVLRPGGEGVRQGPVQLEAWRRGDA